MTNLPITMQDLYDLPIAIRGVYEYNSERGYYRLTAGGTVLNAVRAALHDHAVTAKRLTLSADVNLPDWTNTMAAANAEERKVLLRLRSANSVRIVR